VRERSIPHGYEVFGRGFHRAGVSSRIFFAGCIAIRRSTSRRYSNGFLLCLRHDAIKLLCGAPHNTLIESAKLSGHDPYAYLKDVLVRVLAHPMNRIEELTPCFWKPLPVTS
jgi:hypothetical protein